MFDVTVLVDALLRPDAASAGLLRRLVTERDFELVVSPAPDWNDGDRSIRLELTPQAEAAPEPAAPVVLAPE